MSFDKLTKVNACSAPITPAMVIIALAEAVTCRLSLVWQT